ncbi:MAG: beta-N-acetylhexosaminidase [Pseudomonadota bacterium]
MAVRAGIFGLSGPALLPQEAAFFREVAPWGFILFARNISDPEQVSRLTADLRASVGRDAPILIDQEGGRVLRLGPPHWRRWQPVMGRFDGADEDAALEAARLRYRIIADELRAVGVDVNCAPVLDVLAPEGHDVIGNRALGREPGAVSRRGQAVAEGLLAGGVLPVIKHIPGHGRATVDSHLHLPRVQTGRTELERVDFAPFRAMAHHALAMTGHVVFEAIDPEQCATLSPVVIDLIRNEIGFDGLLMTDDLSMSALDGSMTSRTEGALAAGCDMILHCNGRMDEMKEVAGSLPALDGAAARRAALAEAARTPPDGLDIGAAAQAYEALTGEVLHV